MENETNKVKVRDSIPTDMYKGLPYFSTSFLWWVSWLCFFAFAFASLVLYYFCWHTTSVIYTTPFGSMAVSENNRKVDATAPTKSASKAFSYCRQWKISILQNPYLQLLPMGKNVSVRSSGTNICFLPYWMSLAFTDEGLWALHRATATDVEDGNAKMKKVKFALLKIEIGRFPVFPGLSQYVWRQ